MGKRKQSSPHKTTEEKRKCLTWNMVEGRLETGSMTLIPDNDPSLLQEISEAERNDRVTEPHRSISQTKSSAVPSFISEQLMGAFDENLKSCLFCFGIRSEPGFKSHEFNAQIGKFTVQLIPHEQWPNLLQNDLPKCPECWLYVNDKKGQCMLYFELTGSEGNGAESETTIDRQLGTMFFFCDTSLPVETLETLQIKRLFQPVLSDFNSETLRAEITVFITPRALKVLNYPSEFKKPQRDECAIQTIMEEFYGISIPSYKGTVRTSWHDVEQLYSSIKSSHQSRDPSLHLEVQHANLKPSLRPYQRSAVQWMLEREGFSKPSQAVEEKSVPDKLHQLFQEIQTLDNQTLYYNCFTGCLVQEKPLCVKPLPGGILADEMGLGKTVEVLACMLGHPRQSLPRPEPLPVVEIIQDEEDNSNQGDNEMKKTVVKDEENDVRNVSDDPTVVPKEIDTGKDVDSSSAETVIDGENLHGYDSTPLQHDACGNEMDKKEMETAEVTEETCTTEAEAFSPDANSSADMCGDGNTRDLTTISYAEIRKGDSENTMLCKKTVIPDCTGDAQASKVEQAAGFTESKVPGGKLPSETEEKFCAETVLTKEQQSSDDIVMDGSQENSTKNVEKSLEKTDKTKKSKRGKKPRRVFGELVPVHTLDPSPNGFFSDKPIGRKEYFECICGSKEAGFSYQESMKVQCTQCGLWQHSSCVNYDLTDPYRGPYLCPHCHVVAAPISSGATLIVSPNSICHQWVEEITKHIKEKSIKVFVYTGVTKLKFIQPRTLASFDIVITTYETLRKEIDFVDLPHSNSEAGRRFRHPKRFMAIPSPLIAVQWWRICLDEAQMVEGVTTRTAEMALRLSAVNRWCVTGTPVQKGIQDLFGLLVFLGDDPYWVRGWWNKLLYEPLKHGIHEPLYEVMGKVMWRTAKKDVIDQIQLPGQSEQVKWLTFSPVEDHFYRRQYHTCMREAARTLLRRTDAGTKLTSLDRQTLNSILYPLLSLRQACCHPQAVRGAFLPLQKSTMTMEELLESLTKKATLECEEAHRQLVAALNGLAGLDILKGKYVDAVENYREVFRSIDEHKSQFRTDDLQQLHALHNLREVLNLKPAGVSPTLRDDLLGVQAEELREKYMVKVGAKVSQREETLHPVQDTLRELRREFSGGSEWWIDLLQWVIYIHQDEPLLLKVQEHLRETVNPEMPSIANRFRDLRGLQYILHGQLRDLQTSHDKLIAAIQRLRKKPSQSVIDQTAECCLRPQDKVLKTCPYCKADELFSEYESKLFSISEKGVFADEDDTGLAQVNTKRQGNWSDSELEKTLKTILAFVKMFKADDDMIAYGTTHIKLFEALKKEFKALRGVWLALHEQISNIDELSMATTRLRCRLPEEPKTDPPQRNVIEPSESDHHRMRLLSDRTVGQNELRKKLGQLLYLKNLAKNQDEVNGGSNPEPCPVCQRELGEEWSVLQCGHCYCLDCIRIMVDQYSFGGRLKSLRCAMCRQLTRHTDISNVSTKACSNGEEGEEAITVKGSHSTKVEAVVRALKQIYTNDPLAKSLVFSTWTDVLDKISQALLENDIPHRYLHGCRKFQDNLQTFRHDRSIRALLLPVHSGANGLNLIEATHVLLVEPILNLGEEQQAIGRVHRIGQTRPIKVVRFLVRGTIEEKMYSMFKTMSRDHDDWEENSITVGDVITLLKENEEQDSNHDNNSRAIPLSGDHQSDCASANSEECESVMPGMSTGTNNSEPKPSTSQDFYQSNRSLTEEFVPRNTESVVDNENTTAVEGETSSDSAAINTTQGETTEASLYETEPCPNLNQDCSRNSTLSALSAKGDDAVVDSPTPAVDKRNQNAIK